MERLDGLRRALTALEGGEADHAEAICRSLVARDRADVEALLLLGLALGLRGDTQAAAPVLDDVASRRPGHAHPCRDLAQMLLARGKAEQIAPQYRACLALTPDDPRLCFAFAEFLRDRGGADEAIAVLQPLVRLEPVSAELHNELGLALAEGGRFAEAAGHFREALSRDPGPGAFWANLGMMLKVDGQFDAALDAYGEALARDPNNRRIKLNRAVARMQAGRFAEVWLDEDCTLSEPGRTLLPLETQLPPISRKPDLTDCTVLVLQEEGLGDTLQFLRYLPMLIQRGARVVAAVPEPLIRLMRSIPGIIVPDIHAPVPAFDYHCSFNGLPRAFETTLDSIPCQLPYIQPDTALVRHWLERLQLTDALHVGLVWAGQARPWLPGFTSLDGRRSTGLATLAPLASVPGVQFVSLQKGGAAEQSRTAGFAILDPMDEVHDFADTAAIVAHMDLVISVDTSVVHLAGAMGKPVFMLDRYDNCWRWLSARDDTPWYPSLRIFRQKQPGEWGPIVARVAEALRVMAERPCAPAPTAAPA
jgi:Flp pilus assembly protein TadD